MLYYTILFLSDHIVSSVSGIRPSWMGTYSTPVVPPFCKLILHAVAASRHDAIKTTVFLCVYKIFPRKNRRNGYKNLQNSQNRMSFFLFPSAFIKIYPSLLIFIPMFFPIPIPARTHSPMPYKPYLHWRFSAI